MKFIVIDESTAKEKGIKISDKNALAYFYTLEDMMREARFQTGIGNKNKLKKIAEEIKSVAYKVEDFFLKSCIEEAAARVCEDEV